MHFRSKLLLTALVALVAASFAPGAFAAVKLRACTRSRTSAQSPCT